MYLLTSGLVKSILFIFLIIGAVFANADPCWDQTRPCAQSCCPKIGGTWSDFEDDCLIDENYTDEETLQLLQQHCPNCFNSYAICINNTEIDYSSIPSPTTNCCGPAFIFASLVISIFFVKNAGSRI
ncbi:MAG: hypothetical protein ABH842_01460 [Candidatus Micrarchaeota archaeon]